MTKPEELKTLIEASHIEWKSLSREKLSKVSGYSESTCGRALNLFDELIVEPIIEPKGNSRGKVDRVPKGRASTPPPHNYTNDPDELLMSVSIRMLNKPEPDPRWANILLSCRKENISNKNEAMEEYSALPNSALSMLLKQSRESMRKERQLEDQFLPSESTQNP